MRDFRDAKAMAHALRGALQVKAVDITHGECLELIAKAFGFDDWNVLAAKIEAAVPRAAKATAPVNPAEKTTLYCSFCGKSQHEVRVLIAGPTVFICDECTGLCNGVLDDKEIQALLNADEERGDRAYPIALERLRAKSAADVTTLVERSKRGAERIRIELHCIQQILAAQGSERLAVDDQSTAIPAHLKNMSTESLLAREQHVARNFKRYEDALRNRDGCARRAVESQDALGDDLVLGLTDQLLTPDAGIDDRRHSGSPALRRPSKKAFISFASKMGARRRRFDVVSPGSSCSKCATVSRASPSRPSSTKQTAWKRRRRCEGRPLPQGTGGPFDRFVEASGHLVGPPEGRHREECLRIEWTEPECLQERRGSPHRAAWSMPTPSRAGQEPEGNWRSGRATCRRGRGRPRDRRAAATSQSLPSTARMDRRRHRGAPPGPVGRRWLFPLPVRPPSPEDCAKHSSARRALSPAQSAGRSRLLDREALSLRPRLPASACRNAVARASTNRKHPASRLACGGRGRFRLGGGKARWPRRRSRPTLS